MDEELFNALDDMCDEMGLVRLEDVLNDPDPYIYLPEKAEDLERRREEYLKLKAEFEGDDT